jgi:hypothetical protein
MSSVFMAFAKWIESTRWALAISGSDWAYPFVQWTHFSGLSLWLGTNLAVDFRLLGVGRKNQSAGELSAALFVWNWLGFAIALTGGFMLFASSATQYIPNPAFDLKVGILIPLALILHVVIQLKARAWSATPDPPLFARLAGLLELLLWLGVVTAAVSIPNFDTH